MKNRQPNLLKIGSMLLALLIVALFSVGCSLLDPPTASSNNDETSTDLWSPTLGDEIIPGRAVPIILDENYWNTSGTLDGGTRGRIILAPTFLSIDEDGGIVSCGRHSYVVPAGAVDADVNFSLAIASTSGIAVDCGPSPYYFHSGSPVRLYLSFQGTQYDADYCAQNGIQALDPSGLQIWWDPQNGSALVQVNTGRVVDSNTKTVSVQVDHFSRYILA